MPEGFEFIILEFISFKISNTPELQRKITCVKRNPDTKDKEV
jgi:hypothetical protein